MSALVVSSSLCGVFGLCVGSFANVVAWRIPRGESIVFPASHCPSCDGELAWYDNVPLLSWVLLRGHCRSCRGEIVVRYPIVEGLTAILWVLAAVRFGVNVETAAYLVLFSALVVLSAIDIDVQRVPTRVLYPTIATCGALFVITSAVDDRWADLARAGAGGAIGFAVLFVIHVAKPSGMGFGDVRLAFLLGMSLGFQGLGFVPLGLFAGFVLGAIIGSLAIATGHGEFGRRVPFAPYLAAGTILTLLAGQPIVDWYARLLAR